MKSFLVVDDDSSMVDLYKVLIKRRYGDVSIAHANNGKEALDKAIASDYSIILSDIDMPIMNGIDFHKVLKKESPLLAQRTAFISGGPHELDLAYVREENLPYLPKTFEQNDFYGMTDAILEAEDKKLSKEPGYGCERQYERRTVREECILEPINPEINGGVIKGETVDISEGGLGLKYSGKCCSERFMAKVTIKALNIIDKIAEVRWFNQTNGDFRYGLVWV